MGERTAISWTNKTWNPWQGCHKVSAGCTFCYMYREKKRFGQDPATVVRSTSPTFNAPRKWSERALVFTCSWSDFFIEEADVWRPEAWEIIRATPHLTYQILTKRPERIAEHLPPGWPFPNAWLGVSVEDQANADRRLPVLLATPAAVRFVSAEPLLGPVDLRRYLGTTLPKPYAVLVPVDAGPPRGLDWIIIGGESGPKARPCDVAWIRSLVKQCRAADTACFVKQAGAFPLSACDHFGVKQIDLGGKWRHVLRDGKGGDPSEWPADLRVREMPEVQP